MTQIGTIKIDDSGTVRSFPVYETGESGHSVSEGLRIDVGSQIGFIPIVKNSYAQIRAVSVDTGQFIGYIEKVNFAGDQVAYTTQSDGGLYIADYNTERSYEVLAQEVSGISNFSSQRLPNTQKEKLIFENINEDLRKYDFVTEEGTFLTDGTGDSVAGDFDGDGDEELVVETRRSGADFALIDDSIFDQQFASPGEGIELSAGDVDNDGTDELIYVDFGFDINVYDWVDSSNTELFDGDVGALGVGDIDNDGTEEIIYEDQNDNDLAKYRELGGSDTTVSGVSGFNTILTGDVDGDGITEAVFVSNSSFDVFDQVDGTVDSTNTSSFTDLTSLGDVDNDGKKEIIGHKQDTDKIVAYNGTSLQKRFDVIGQDIVGTQAGNFL